MSHHFDHILYLARMNHLVQFLCEGGIDLHPSVDYRVDHGCGLSGPRCFDQMKYHLVEES